MSILSKLYIYALKMKNNIRISHINQWTTKYNKGICELEKYVQICMCNVYIYARILDIDWLYILHIIVIVDGF